jgi:hypothetical protein
VHTALGSTSSTLLLPSRRALRSYGIMAAATESTRSIDR